MPNWILLPSFVFSGVLALILTGCGMGPAPMSSVLDVPVTGVTIQNFLDPTGGMEGDGRGGFQQGSPNDVRIIFGVDRGPEGFRASNQQFTVSPGTQIPVDRIKYDPANPHVMATDRWGNIIPANIQYRENRAGTGQTMNIGIGQPHMRQLREVEPQRFNDRLLPSPTEVLRQQQQHQQQPPPQEPTPDFGEPQPEIL